MKKWTLALAAVTAVVMAGSAAAFPTRPLTIVVPFAAGGPTDKVARDFAQSFSQILKQNVIVENVGGAGGTLGATRVARAQPDGHTLLLFHIGMATTASLYRNLPYKPLEDFEYLGMINDSPMTLVGRPTLPPNNYAELRKWLDENKGKVNLANAGLGSASHLCGLLFQQMLGIPMTTIAYKGTAPAMTDILGGQVDIMCDQTTNTVPQIAGGRIKAYAVSTLQPLKSPPALANLPTLDSQGLKGFNVSIWHGLYAPKGTPAAAQKVLNDALREVLKDQEFVGRMEALGAVIVTDDRVDPAGHKKFVANEIEVWGKAIRAAGQYAD